MNASDGHDGHHLPSSEGTNKTDNVTHPSTSRRNKPNESTHAKNNRSPQNQSSTKFDLEESTARGPTSLPMLTAMSHTKTTPPSAKNCARRTPSKSGTLTSSTSTKKNSTYQSREEEQQQRLRTSYDKGRSPPACPSSSQSPSSRNRSPQEQLSVLNTIMGKAKGSGGEEEGTRRKGNNMKSFFEQEHPPLHSSKKSSLSPRRIQHAPVPTADDHDCSTRALDEADDPQQSTNTATDAPMIEVRVSVPIPPCVSRLPFTLATAKSSHSFSEEGEEDDDADDVQENLGGRHRGRRRPQQLSSSSVSSSTFNIDSTPVRNNSRPPSLLKVQTIDNELMPLCTQQAQQQHQVSASSFSSSSSLLVKLKEGDIIVRINGIKPKSLPDAKERLAKLLSSRRTIDLDVLRRPSQLMLKNTSGARYGNFFSSSSYESSSSSSVAGKGKIGIAKMSRNFNIEDSVAVGVLGGVEEFSFSEQREDEVNEVGKQEKAEKDHHVDNADDGHESYVSQEYGVERNRAAAPSSGTTTHLQYVNVSTENRSSVVLSSPCPMRPADGQIVFSPTSSPHSTQIMTAMPIELERIKGADQSSWKAPDEKITEHKMAVEDGHPQVLFEGEGKEAVSSSSSPLFVPTFASANRPTEGPAATPFISLSASQRGIESTTLNSVGTSSSHSSDLLVSGVGKAEKVGEHNAAESGTTGRRSETHHYYYDDENTVRKRNESEDKKNTLGIACESTAGTTLCMTQKSYGSCGELTRGDDVGITRGEAGTRRQAFDNTSVVPFASDSESEFESESETDYSSNAGDYSDSMDSLDELDEENNDDNAVDINEAATNNTAGRLHVKGASFDDRENEREYYRLGKEILRLFRKNPHLIDVVLLGGGGGGHENTGPFLADKYSQNSSAFNPLLLAATADTIDRRIHERFAKSHANQNLHHHHHGSSAQSLHGNGIGGILGGAPLAAQAASAGNNNINTTNMYGTPNDSEDDEGGGQQTRLDGGAFSFDDCGITKKSAGHELSDNFHIPSMHHWPYSSSRSLSHLSLFVSFSSSASGISSLSSPQQGGPTDMYWPFTPQIGCDDSFHATMRNLIETENKFFTEIKPVAIPRERVLNALQKLKERIERREQVFMANARRAAEKAVGPAPTLTSLDIPVIASGIASSSASGVGAGAPVPRGRLQKELAAREQMAKQKRLQALLAERENKIKLIVSESLKNRRAMETDQKMEKKRDRQNRDEEGERYVGESEVRGQNGRVGNVLSQKEKRKQRKPKNDVRDGGNGGGIPFGKVIGTLFPFFDPSVGFSKNGNDNFGYPAIDGKKVQEELFGAVTAAFPEHEEHRRDANEEDEGEEGRGRKVTSRSYSGKRPREGDALSEKGRESCLEGEELTIESDNKSTAMITSSNRNRSRTMFLFEKMYEATAAEIRRDRAAAANNHHDHVERRTSDHHRHSHREHQKEKVNETVTKTATFSTHDDPQIHSVYQQAEHSETKSTISTFSGDVGGGDYYNNNDSHNKCTSEHLSGKGEVSSPSDFQNREAGVGAVSRAYRQHVHEHVAATAVEDAVTCNAPLSSFSLSSAAPVTANIRMRAPREELLRQHREAVALAKQLALEGVIGGQGRKGKGGLGSGSEYEHKKGGDRTGIERREENEEEHKDGDRIVTIRHANRDREGKGNNNETARPNNEDEDEDTMAVPPPPPQNKRKRLVFMRAFKQHDDDMSDALSSAYPPYPSLPPPPPPPPPPPCHNTSTHSSVSNSHAMRTETAAAVGETTAPSTVMPTMSQEERDTIRRRHREMLQQQREAVERLKKERGEKAADSSSITTIHQNAAGQQQSPASLAPPLISQEKSQQQMYPPALRSPQPSPADDLMSQTKRSPQENQQASLTQSYHFPPPQSHPDLATLSQNHIGAEPQLLAQLHAQNQQTLQQMQMAVSAEVQRRGMQQHFQQQQQQQQRLYSHSQQYGSGTYQQHFPSQQPQQQHYHHVYHAGGVGGLAVTPPPPMYSVDPFMGPPMSGGGGAASTTAYNLASPTTPVGVRSFHQQSLMMQSNSNNSGSSANLGSPPMMMMMMNADAVINAAVASSPAPPIAPMGMVYHPPSSPSAASAFSFSAHSAANFPAQPPHYPFYQQ